MADILKLLNRIKEIEGDELEIRRRHEKLSYGSAVRPIRSQGDCDVTMRDDVDRMEVNDGGLLCYEGLEKVFLK